MGGCVSSSQPVFGRHFQPVFTVKLEALFDSYLKVVQHARKEKLFLDRSERLEKAVASYLANQADYNKEDLDLCAVAAVHKLHPHDYFKSTATAEWLIAACLRQHKFVEEFPYNLLTFKSALKNYIEFLFMCSSNPFDIIVPDQLADFMWHSHMQNPLKYKRNMLILLNRFLNHSDDFPPEDFAKYAKRTVEIRQELDHKARLLQISANVHCGGYGG